MHKTQMMGRWSVVTTGLVALGALSAVAHAQESLGGLGAASGISASMSGMSSSGTITAGQRASGQAGSFGSSSGEFPDPSGSGSGSPGSPGAGGIGGGALAAPVRIEPRRWNPRLTGQSILSELLGGSQMPKIPSPIGKSRSPRGQAKLATKINKMTAAQRRRLVLQKYDIRPKNWLAHYVLEDRYKINSGLWGFVTTRTSRFYYRPWAMAMLKADSNHAIGFHTWQDAMLAGYRPDPVSRPEPAAQIANLASFTRGDALSRYVEFVYAGQISPKVFGLNYSYVKQVAQIVRSHDHTRPLLGETVDQILLASLGEGSVPRSVGGPPPVPAGIAGAEGSGMSSPMTGMNSSMSGMSSSMSSSSSGNVPPGGSTDTRGQEFNNFSSRAGGLANVPANRP